MIWNVWRDWAKKDASTWLLKVGLGVLFGFAGIAKIAEPAVFAEEIANYRFFPDLAPYAASTLPGLEIVLAGVLIFAGARSSWLHAAAAVAVGLMAFFTIAVTQVVARGINIECGCFGGESGPVTSWTILRDVGLLAACAALWVLARRDASRLKTRAT